MVDYVAKTVVECLVEEELLAIEGSIEPLEAEVRRMITDDLLVEDRLNDEVKEILRAHTAEIDRGDIDYSRMFAMVKRKLVQERGLIL